MHRPISPRGELLGKHTRRHAQPNQLNISTQTHDRYEIRTAASGYLVCSLVRVRAVACEAPAQVKGGQQGGSAVTTLTL